MLESQNSLLPSHNDIEKLSEASIQPAESKSHLSQKSRVDGLSKSARRLSHKWQIQQQKLGAGSQTRMKSSLSTKSLSTQKELDQQNFEWLHRDTGYEIVKNNAVQEIDPYIETLRAMKDLSKQN